MEIKIIETEKQYKACLNRMNEIFHAEVGTPEGEELEQLAGIIEKYEDQYFPMQ